MRRLYLTGVVLSMFMIGITVTHKEIKGEVIIFNKPTKSVSTITNINTTGSKLASIKPIKIGNIKLVSYTKKETASSAAPKSTTSSDVKTKSKVEDSKQQSTSKDESNLNMAFKLTYYTDLASENSGYEGITCTGDKLVKGDVANNYYKLGTKIYLEGIGEVTVADRGGSNFNNSTRLDVYVPRNKGESDSEYKTRVNNMGIKSVQGKVVQ